MDEEINQTTTTSYNQSRMEIQTLNPGKKRFKSLTLEEQQIIFDQYNEAILTGESKKQIANNLSSLFGRPIWVSTLIRVVNKFKYQLSQKPCRKIREKNISAEKLEELLPPEVIEMLITGRFNKQWVVNTTGIHANTVGEMMKRMQEELRRPALPPMINAVPIRYDAKSSLFPADSIHEDMDASTSKTTSSHP